LRRGCPAKHQGQTWREDHDRIVLVLLDYEACTSVEISRPTKLGLLNGFGEFHGFHAWNLINEPRGMNHLWA
jgi:hypothetical protein